MAGKVSIGKRQSQANSMKPGIYTITLFLFIGIMLPSCDEDMEFGSAYNKSYQAWLGFKDSSGNSYRYTVNGHSWVGLNWETIITVTNGQVTQREFRYTFIAPGADVTIPEEDLEWIETENELDTHESGPAADVQTMEQVYSKAKNDWLRARKNIEAYFETENQGMISLCGYVPKGCADDCFRGIEIESIEALP